MVSLLRFSKLLLKVTDVSDCRASLCLRWWRGSIVLRDDHSIFLIIRHRAQRRDCLRDSCVLYGCDDRCCRRGSHQAILPLRKRARGGGLLQLDKPRGRRGEGVIPLVEYNALSSRVPLCMCSTGLCVLLQDAQRLRAGKVAHRTAAR